MSALRVVPLTLAKANDFIAAAHRHHKPAIGCKFCIGVVDGDKLVGVCIVGRPVARHADDGTTAEVTRLATDGTKNACSMLYGAAARAARAMGYQKIQTYILIDEPGTSLRASGWQMEKETRGEVFWGVSRERPNEHVAGKKQRWARRL